MKKNIFTLLGSGKQKCSRGFTLPEILIAIGIFIIILGVVIVRLDDARTAGRDAIRVKDLGEISGALEKYYTKNNTYPVSLNDLQPDFLAEVPQDPKDGSSYPYCNDDGKYALMAKLETNSKALESDYDKDWPDTGTACDCNGNGTIGDTTVELEEEDSENLYTYCIKNP